MSNLFSIIHNDIQHRIILSYHRWDLVDSESFIPSKFINNKTNNKKMSLKLNKLKTGEWYSLNEDGKIKMVL